LIFIISFGEITTIVIVTIDKSDKKTTNSDSKLCTRLIIYDVMYMWIWPWYRADEYVLFKLDTAEILISGS
jgi:hypothetical protein